MRQRVYICSPYAGTAEQQKRNSTLAAGYCRAATLAGYSPIAPHIYYPQFLDDDAPDERNVGLQLGIEALDTCTELWVVGETLSAGMVEEIRLAKQKNMKIRYFTTKMEEKKNGYYEN